MHIFNTVILFILILRKKLILQKNLKQSFNHANGVTDNGHTCMTEKKLHYIRHLHTKYKTSSSPSTFLKNKALKQLVITGSYSICRAFCDGSHRLDKRLHCTINHYHKFEVTRKPPYRHAHIIFPHTRYSLRNDVFKSCSMLI